MKFFMPDGVLEYNGGRTDLEIIDWVNRKSGRLYLEFDSLYEFDKLCSERKIIIAFFGDKKIHKKEFEEFLKVN